MNKHENPLEPTMEPWGIAKIKYHQGHEGEPCAQGTLVYRGDKTRDVARFSQDEWGGAMRFTPVDKALWDKFQQFCKETPMSFEMPGVYGIDTVALEHEKDAHVVEMLLEHQELVKRLKSLVVKDLVFRSPGDAEGEWQRLVGRAKDEPAYRWVKEQFPLACIANEHLVARNRPHWFPGTGGKQKATA